MVLKKEKEKKEDDADLGTAGRAPNDADKSCAAE
eukprot:gene9555-7802_t